MSWIRKIPYAEAAGKLRQLYDRIKGPDGYLDNILTIHGQRPHSLEGHMALYKNVLHHRDNKLPKWVLEMLGVYVSYLNGCEYCFDHHEAGMAALLQDEEKRRIIRGVLRSGKFSRALESREVAMLEYARKLTQSPVLVSEPDIRALKEAGLDEGEILELNQVVSYFAYANRTVQGLGVTTEGDVLGLSPSDSDNPDDWHHGDAKP